ncbi:MAG: hypothetical protein EXQ88_01640 [Alphaproteobacteria bacterium]|nr:hypothetical protein [Alphaproteobacteria bacterium]
MRKKRKSRLGIILVASGIVLDLIGSGALAYGAVALNDPLIVLGQLWFRLDNGSLNFLQAITQRYIYAPLWENGIVPILLQPAFVVFSLPGALLLIAGILLLRSPRH